MSESFYYFDYDFGYVMAPKNNAMAPKHSGEKKTTLFTRRKRVRRLKCRKNTLKIRFFSPGLHFVFKMLHFRNLALTLYD
jgi:hypothetical protein